MNIEEIDSTADKLANLNNETNNDESGFPLIYDEQDWIISPWIPE